MSLYAKVSFEIIRASSLLGMNIDHKSNPFVKVEIGKQNFTTPTLTNTCDPNWREAGLAQQCTFQFPAIHVPTVVTISVYNKLPYGDQLSDFIGQASVTVMQPGQKTQNIPLTHGGNMQLANRAPTGCGMIEVAYDAVEVSENEYFDVLLGKTTNAAPVPMASLPPPPQQQEQPVAPPLIPATYEKQVGVDSNRNPIMGRDRGSELNFAAPENNTLNPQQAQQIQQQLASVPATYEKQVGETEDGQAIMGRDRGSGIELNFQQQQQQPTPDVSMVMNNNNTNTLQSQPPQPQSLPQQHQIPALGFSNSGTFQNYPGHGENVHQTYSNNNNNNVAAVNFGSYPGHQPTQSPFTNLPPSSSGSFYNNNNNNNRQPPQVPLQQFQPPQTTAGSMPIFEQQKNSSSVVVQPPSQSNAFPVPEPQAHVAFVPAAASSSSAPGSARPPLVRPSSAGGARRETASTTSSARGGGAATTTSVVHHNNTSVLMNRTTNNAHHNTTLNSSTTFGSLKTKSEKLHVSASRWFDMIRSGGTAAGNALREVRAASDKDPSVVLEACDATGRTLLHEAAWTGTIELFQELLALAIRAGNTRPTAMSMQLWASEQHNIAAWTTPSETSKYVTPNAGNTVLHTAAAAGRSDLVDWMLRQGAVFVAMAQTRNKRGLRPLESAAERGHMETAQILARSTTA
jgi:hypothetical protein